MTLQIRTLHLPWYRRPWVIYAVVFAIAWLVRLAYLVEMSDHPSFHLPLVDAGEYHALAQAVATGQQPLPKLSWQPWFYPLTLAQLYRVTGPSVWAAKMLQISVGSLTCVFVAALAYLLWPRPAIRWIAGLAAALYGPLIHTDGELLAEPWAALGLTVAAWLAFRYRHKPGDRLALALGVLGALLLFIRPPLLAGWLPLLLVAATAWVRNHSSLRRVVLPHFVLLLLGFGLAAWPFVHAIQTATGTTRWLPVTGGINFYIGNSARPCETINIRPGYAWENLTLWPELHGARTDDEKDAFFRRQAEQDIQAHPRIFFRNLASKGLQFFSAREIPRNIDLYVLRGESLLLRPLVWKIGKVGFPFGLLIGLAAVGLWARRPGSFGLLLAIAGYAAAIIAVHVCDRYRLPVIPLFIVLAAVGILALADAARKHRYPQLAGGAGLILLLGFASSAAGPFCAEQLDYQAELDRLIAVTAYEHQEPALAETYARKALAQNPREAQAWNQLGLVEVQRGLFDEATAHFQRAVDCDPVYSMAWFNLGKAAAQRERFPDAIGFFREGLQHAPAYLPAWIELGDLLRKDGQPDEAQACYREVLRIRPGFPPALRRIAASANIFHPTR